MYTNSDMILLLQSLHTQEDDVKDDNPLAVKQCYSKLFIISMNIIEYT